MKATDLHKAQASILRTLRHTPSARYTILQRPTGMDSDVFKFHLRKLAHLGYVRKLGSGEYALTPPGKEFANNLSKLQHATQKQPKLSVVIIAERAQDGTKQYLFQQRLRNPFYGFWGSLSGPVQWGEPIEETARREFEKQTGLTATYTVRAFCRKTDHAHETNALLEDKLFVVIQATDVCGEITNAWQKGCNVWMSLSELESKEKYFASTRAFITMLETGESYQATSTHYSADEY